jgi:hypothetical protein
VKTRQTQERVQVTLEGLIPGHFALDMPSGVLAHLTCEEGKPCLREVQVFTPSELTVLRPLLEQYPNYCPYEVLVASFGGSTSDVAITRARQRFYHALEKGTVETLMRPVRNVLSRTRLKLHAFGIDIVSMLETGCMLRPVRKRAGDERSDS